MEHYLVNTANLADIFGVSERQIQRLVEAGVIEPAQKSTKGYTFNLFVVVPQYSAFLTAKAAGQADIGSWAPDSK